MRVLPVAALVFAALSFGCDTQSMAPRVAREALVIGAPVVPGGMLTLEYTNVTGLAFRVNPCLREVEQLRDGVWVSLGEELRSCMDELQTVSAAGVTAIQLDVPLTLAAGIYRLKLAAQPLSSPVDPAVHDIVTESFEVTQ